MKWLIEFKQEILKNPTIKSRLIIFLYRLSSIFYSKNKNPLKYFFIIFVVFYYFAVEVIWGIEIKPKTKIGWGFLIYHPTAIIINPGAIIGRDFIIRHGITIGNKYNRVTNQESKCPVIGNNVELGAYAMILGGVVIGDHCTIGAMAYVDFDMADKTMVAAPRGILIKGKRDER